MITVVPAEAQACIDGIPPGHRPLFERLHRLILTAHPGAQVTLSYKMPACKAGNRRLYAGAWNMGILVHGWQKDRDGGFTSRHTELVTSKATLQLRDGGAPGISDEDFLGLARRPGPLTRTRQASLQRHACRVTSGKPGQPPANPAASTPQLCAQPGSAPE